MSIMQRKRPRRDNSVLIMVISGMWTPEHVPICFSYCYLTMFDQHIQIILLSQRNELLALKASTIIM